MHLPKRSIASKQWILQESPSLLMLLRPHFAPLQGKATLPRGISGALHPTEMVVVIPEEQTHRGGGFCTVAAGAGNRGSREKGFVPLSRTASGNEAHEGRRGVGSSRDNVGTAVTGGQLGGDQC